MDNLLLKVVPTINKIPPTGVGSCDELHGLLDAVRLHDDRQELLQQGDQAQGLGPRDHLRAVGLHHHQLRHRHHPRHRLQIHLRSFVSRDSWSMEFNVYCR